MAKVKKLSEGQFQTFTAFLLGLATTTALSLPDLGFPASFGGALFGSGVIYIFPAIMMTRTIKKMIAEGKWKNTRALMIEYKANVGIIFIGLIFGGVGAAVAVLKNFTNIL
eukprot:CAMPEP_0113951902 /NCGR_PEP_ID=MMETSP1339-20121228/88642_1 /TAXON_ID=94617 /ORGANISM="Fibrocapsa japonica" /LENGTH=110 /DNA_ID=CAMNT_0000960329 /DNA_START=32 /DNA_END=364 /DNA_ORIENTATION=+ /assembly_acc=CAM_ASM_000762